MPPALRGRIRDLGRVSFLDDMDGLGRTGRGGCRPIAALAGRQHGVVAMGQLRALGFARGAIRHRLRRGAAAADPPRRLRGRPRLADLSGGVGSRRCSPAGPTPCSAIGVPRRYGTWPVREYGGRSHRQRKAGRRPGVLRHGSTIPAGGGGDARDGIPVTTPARTHVWTSPTSPRGLASSGRWSKRSGCGLLDLREVDGVCARNPGRRGLKTLLPLLAGYHCHPGYDARSSSGDSSTSAGAHGLPLPACNVTVAGLEVDCLWPRERVIVELDGFEWHRTRAAFEADRRRDAALVRAGYRVLRVTARRLSGEPAEVTADVRALLELTPLRTGVPVLPHDMDGFGREGGG